MDTIKYAAIGTPGLQRRPGSATGKRAIAASSFAAVGLVVVYLAPRDLHPAPISGFNGAPGSVSGDSGFLNAFQAPADGFVTNAKVVQTFPWAEPTMSVKDAADAAFPDGKGWTDISFIEGAGGTWTFEAVVDWVEKDLLNGPDPFALHGIGRVPLPYTAKDAQGGKFSTPRDQLEPGQFVSYSRRQVCFIVAKSLIGAKTSGYANGLERFMHKSVYDKCTAAQGDFGRAWWTLLAACAADANLVAGAQGPILLVAKARDEPPMLDVRLASAGAPLRGAGLRTCSVDDGTPEPLAGERVPEEGCKQPTPDEPGTDFMSGGLQGQAVQDISALFLGGYIYGNVCDLGGGQDERLMVYYPEVSALTFFLSEAGPDGAYGPPQLRQPAWILGARRVRIGLDGTCLHEHLFEVDPDVPMSSDLVQVKVGAAYFEISASKPFLAFMSSNQGFLGWPETQEDLRLARRNRSPKQRDIDPSSQSSFEKQVRAWFHAVSLTSYDEAVQPVLSEVVTSIGTGPWGAGLWWGDSQLSFLASWIGHSMAVLNWGQPLPMDYYLYSYFTENPGNQCLLHSRDSCEACAKRCPEAAAGQLHAFWLPGNALMTPGDSSKPCAVSADDCGTSGLERVVQRFSSQTAGELWGAIELLLAGAAEEKEVTTSVFDLLVTPSDSGRLAPMAFA